MGCTLAPRSQIQEFKVLGWTGPARPAMGTVSLDCSVFMQYKPRAEEGHPASQLMLRPSAELHGRMRTHDLVTSRRPKK